MSRATGLTAQNHAELEEQGFTIIPKIYSPELCAGLRNLMDSILGDGMYMKSPAANGGVYGHDGDARTLEQLRERREALVTSGGGGVHSIRHPICDPLIADAVSPAMLDIHAELLRSADGDLRLMQHFARRTDLSPPNVLPPKGAFGATAESPMPGWHVDGGFAPRAYTTTPKQIFYHSMVALNKVAPGGGAIMILPDAYRQVKATIHGMSREQILDCYSPEHGAYSIGREVQKRLNEAHKVDLESGMEMLLDEGDLFVVDPMMLHAATPNTRSDLPGYRRYVLFSTFFDAATTDHLLPMRGSSGPPVKYPPEMTDALPSFLFDWAVPTAEHARAAVEARL
jgi:hypothetical protein